MASQITHIVVADQLFNRYFSRHNRRDFFIGSVFPNIRYLGEVSREATHKLSATWEDLLAENNSFRAGLMLHAHFDQAREKYLSEQGLYANYPCDRVTCTSIKLLEDELLYDTVNNWPEIIAYLQDIKFYRFGLRESWIYFLSDRKLFIQGGFGKEQSDSCDS